MQRRGFRRGAGVAADQVQLRHRHVQAVALGVFDVEELAGHAADVHRDQAAIAADAVVLVDDRRALGQLAEVADDRFGLAAGALAAARLGGALGEQLALGEHARARVVEREAVLQRRDGDARSADRSSRRRRKCAARPVAGTGKSGDAGAQAACSTSSKASRRPGESAAISTRPG
jgi:hypothetical protein